MKLNIVRGVVEANRDVTVGEFMDLYHSGIDMELFVVAKEPETNYAEELVASL